MNNPPETPYQIELAKLREKYSIYLEPTYSRRVKWTTDDTKSVKRMLKDGYTIREAAEIARCSERTVQDVKKGLRD